MAGCDEQRAGSGGVPTRIASGEERSIPRAFTGGNPAEAYFLVNGLLLSLYAKYTTIKGAGTLRPHYQPFQVI